MAADTLELFLLKKESQKAQAKDNRSRNRVKTCKTNACNRVSTNMIKLRTKNQNESELVQDH